MDESALSLLPFLLRRGADYADVRRVSNRRESLRVRNGVVVSIGGISESGWGIRVLAGGAWGFAATDEPEALETTGLLALEIARASSLALRERVVWPAAPPVTGEWSSPCEIDPFEVPLERKVELLLDATERMRGDDRVAAVEGEMALLGQEKLFVSTEGSRTRQSRVECGAGIVCSVSDADDAQRRSWPNSYGGNAFLGGFEVLLGLELAENAPRIRDEALALLAAPPVPAGLHDLVIGSSQMALQIHESVGHPTELDRILGTELSLAGGSFLDVGMLDRFRYGSPAMTIVADATLPGGCGSFGFDDEGTPASRQLLVEGGLLRGFLSSRETAARIGRSSGGTMRAESWNHLPLIRMTNVDLEPGTVPFEELVADTKSGVLVDTNKSWSIDDRRLNFQFGCEVAWQIENGRIGRIFKNPVYTGRTPEFWGRLDAVADPAAFRLWCVPTCGKGDPLQVVRVAHGSSPARFRGVEMR
jgi:TldD protein